MMKADDLKNMTVAEIIAAVKTISFGEDAKIDTTHDMDKTVTEAMDLTVSKIEEAILAAKEKSVCTLDKVVRPKDILDRVFIIFALTHSVVEDLLNGATDLLKMLVAASSQASFSMAVEGDEGSVDLLNHTVVDEVDEVLAPEPKDEL